MRYACAALPIALCNFEQAQHRHRHRRRHRQGCTGTLPRIRLPSVVKCGCQRDKLTQESSSASRNLTRNSRPPSDNRASRTATGSTSSYRFSAFPHTLSCFLPQAVHTAELNAQLVLKQLIMLHRMVKWCSWVCCFCGVQTSGCIDLTQALRIQQQS